MTATPESNGPNMAICRPQFSLAAFRAVRRPAPDLGAAVAGTGHLGRSRPARSQPLDTGAWFGRSAPLVLEIGCGSGTSTLAMAQDEPDIDVIAVEIYRRGLAQLLSAIDREQVRNIRLIRGNGIDVLQHLIAPASLTGVRVFFPDPWPKARHHKRRFLQAGHGWPDRRPATPRWCPARRDGPPRVCRANRRSRRRRTPAVSASIPARTRCRSRSFAPPPSTRRRPTKRAAPSPS